MNYFLISVDTDFTNNLISEKIEESLSNIKNTKSIYFVRANDSLVLNNSKNKIYYGDKKTILSYDNMVADKMYRQAKIESVLYRHANIELTDDIIRNEWSKLSSIKQKSNLYSIASIYFKMNLFKSFDENKYFEMYDPNNDRKKQTNFKLFITKQNKFYPRDVLAFIEHERWNAFELSIGVLPMKISDSIKNEGNKAIFKNKSDNEMYHLCITTQKGLVDYYNLINSYDNLIDDSGNIVDGDVIKYDYDIMDNLLVHLNNLK